MDGDFQVNYVKDTRPCLVVPLLALLGACDDMGVDPSLLSGPRVLAIRAEPRVLPEADAPDAPVMLEALVHDATSFDWQLCAAPWQGADNGASLACASGAVAIGTGNPMIFTPPDELDSFYVLLTAGEALPAVLRLTRSADAPLPNPEVTALQTEDGSPLPTSLTPEQALAIDVVATNPSETELVATLYTTGGGIDPWRSVLPSGSTITAPAEPGPFKVTAVVRDEAGGTGWRTETIEVAPAATVTP